MLIIRIGALLEKILGRTLGVIASFPFSPQFLQKRLLFEKLNLNCKASEPFYKSGRSAHACFQFSSEGELEQAAFLIESMISQQKCIELVYTSESVEKKVQAIYQKHPSNIRILRYGFFNQVDLKKWRSANLVFLVRYDFFPRFILSIHDGTFKVLLSASFKKQRLFNRKVSIWNRAVFPLFDQIVFATQEDQTYYKKWARAGQSLIVGDFRALQIMNRLNSRLPTLRKKLPNLTSYQSWLAQSDLNIIVGSAWQEDILQLKNQLMKVVEKGGKILIVPHQLNPQKIKMLQDIFLNEGYQCTIVDETQRWDSVASIAVLNVKGILCELYPDFQFAIVGGGWSSVHSLMEPFLAGCYIFCGPRVERSTEVEFVSAYSSHSLSVLLKSEDFLKKIFSQQVNKGLDSNVLKKIRLNALKAKEMVMRETD